MKKIFKKFIVCFLVVLFTTLSLTAEAAIIELPNENQVPKMITMSLYGDSSQMAFNYNTNWKTETVLQVVEVGSEFDSNDLKEFNGTTVKSMVSGDGYIHRVLATGLKENTKYKYRLGDKELNIWSDVGTFKTADNSNTLKFIHISDPQCYEPLHSKNYNELLKMAVGNSTPNFIALTGDIVNNSKEDDEVVLEQWEWALTDQKDILQNIPVMATAGNHDAAENDFNSRFNYAASSNTTNGCYYSFDYNGVHFTVLNTNDTNDFDGLSNEQLVWLENDLKQNQNASFRIVMMHKGIYDTGGHSSNSGGEDADIKILREQLTMLFTNYNVDLVLQGHDHLYSRSYPITSVDTLNALTTYERDGKKVSQTYNGLNYSMYQNPKGTIYLNSGTASGSKYHAAVEYNKNLIPIAAHDSSVNRMYSEICIDGENLYVTVYKLNNKELVVYDTFGISKTTNNDTTNNVIDEIKTNDTNYTLFIVIGAIGLVFILGLTTFIISKKRGGNR